ncbi:hypothetical protein BDP81DRAFT_53014 [Colletotrichum phormii]|uniref:Uncharacterized protein n=1 Tax=Colletotrichum phormii TaxID=359342 RepID=A0AAJ0ECH7_9PEZI|nr:uncharacterized protein BDP81DRAFT_53014 [Colletotrichum phormii]KAK1634777.1 hypothetical protein BDP81DRAFT_53014 [Colletotrichum phormii]
MICSFHAGMDISSRLHLWRRRTVVVHIAPVSVVLLGSFWRTWRGRTPGKIGKARTVVSFLFSFYLKLMLSLGSLCTRFNGARDQTRPDYSPSHVRPVPIVVQLRGGEMSRANEILH